MKNKLAIIAPAILLCIGIGIAYEMIKNDRVLPIYSPAMINPELVDKTKQDVTKGHRIGDFVLTNQDGEELTNKDFDSYYYVADFFFTTCPSICPIMTENMSFIQNTFKNDSSVLLLSHSVTPKIDSVAQLKKYALEKGVIDEKWHLVTGPKKEIYDLARQSYLAVKTNESGNLYDMIHTENFILIDPDRRIRGFYDGTVKEDMKEIQKDILNLKAEYSIN